MLFCVDCENDRVDEDAPMLLRDGVGRSVVVLMVRTRRLDWVR